MTISILPLLTSTTRSMRSIIITFPASLHVKRMHTSATVNAKVTKKTEVKTKIDKTSSLAEAEKNKTVCSILESAIHREILKKATKKPEIQTEIEKTSYLEETEKNKAVCSILESVTHREILKKSSIKSIADIVAIYILASDIKVHRIALESNFSFFVKGHRAITRTKILKVTKALAPEIKVGAFTIEEKEIIRENWKNLIQRLDLVEDEIKSELFKDARKDKSLGLKRNIVGYHLAQRFQNIRLAAEVFHKAKTLLSATKGKFSPEEDQIILDFVEKKGEKFAELTSLLQRRSFEAVKYRFEALCSKKNHKQGALTVEEGEILLREVFKVNKNILHDGKLSREHCQNIGEKLSRPPTSIYNHWKQVMEPLLKTYHSETELVDIKELLIQHMIDHEMDYNTQQVDWKELVKLSKFAHTTPVALRRTYHNLRSATKNKYPELSEEELSTGAIQRYLRGRSRRHFKKRKDEDYQEMIKKYYVTNILMREN